MTIAPGVYRHYKGGEYDVLFVATLEATGEPLVIYRARYGDHSIWARPVSVFTEHVTINGEVRPRFTKID